MKKQYIKPFIETTMAEFIFPLQASNTGSGGTTMGGGEDGTEDQEKGGSGSGGDGEFSGGLGSKDHNAWSSWDE